jgi:hypothetical protein
VKKEEMTEPENQAVLEPIRLRKVPIKISSDFLWISISPIIINQKGDRRRRSKLRNHKFAIFHHSVQSIFNKQMELKVLLNTSLHNIKVLCFTEHWLSEDQLVLLEINNFKLVNKFCRKDCKNGGSCVFVTKELNTREITFLNDLSCEKNFELAVVEIVEFKWLLVCIYRSPHSDGIFLEKLETLVDRIHKERKK